MKGLYGTLNEELLATGSGVSGLDASPEEGVFTISNWWRIFVVVLSVWEREGMTTRSKKKKDEKGPSICSPTAQGSPYLSFLQHDQEPVLMPETVVDS